MVIIDILAIIIVAKTNSNNGYSFMEDGKLIATYSNLSQALEDIRFNNLSLREMLLDTDFDFHS